MQIRAFFLLSLILSGFTSGASEPTKATVIRNLEAGHPQKIVAYGTSFTAGGAWVRQVEAQLLRDFPKKVTVINTGQGGMWSAWGVKHLQERVLDLKPDAVFVEFAANDAFLPYRTSLMDCRKNLENIIDRIKTELPKCEIILMAMTPVVDVPTGKHASLRPKLNDYYQVYRDVAAERRLRCIDHYPAWKKLLDADRAAFDRYVPDGAHPNAEACRVLITPRILENLKGAPNS